MSNIHVEGISGISIYLETSKRIQFEKTSEPGPDVWIKKRVPVVAQQASELRKLVSYAAQRAFRLKVQQRPVLKGKCSSRGMHTSPVQVQEEEISSMFSLRNDNKQGSNTKLMYISSLLSYGL